MTDSARTPGARFLSHPLSPTTPVYPGTPAVQFDPRSRIADGDEANWLVVTTGNHAGTHVDGPWHFDPKGRPMSAFSAAELVFQAPCLIDLPRGDDELITADDLRPFADELGSADMAVVRTGFGRIRETDPYRYATCGPGFDPSAAWYLTKETAVRALVMDCISATCQAHLADGHAFHRIALGAYSPGREILLVEDARLDDDLAGSDLGLVIVGALLLEDQDGGPATIIALPRPA